MTDARSLVADLTIAVLRAERTGDPDDWSVVEHLAAWLATHAHCHRIAVQLDRESARRAARNQIP